MSRYWRCLIALTVMVILGGCVPSGDDALGTPVDITVPPPTDPAASDTPSAIESPSPIAATDAPTEIAPTDVDTTQRACSVPEPQPSSGTIRFAFVTTDGNLYLQDGDRTPQQLTTTGDALNVQISTDGSLIAYSRDPEGYPSELWVVNADGSNAHRVLGEPAIEALDPLITEAPFDYSLGFRWIPHHHELIVRAWADLTPEPSYVQQVADYRIDVERLALDRFEGEWRSPFSPDGEWFATTEDNSLSLIRTDGSQSLRRVLDGYQWIGITSYSILPPLAWLPDGVRVILPQQGNPDADPRFPPFEIWDVSYEGASAKVDSIISDESIFISHLYLALNGQYYVFYKDQGTRIKYVGGGDELLVAYPLNGADWNPTSTHYVDHVPNTLYLVDVCGSLAVIMEDVPTSDWYFDVKWLDAGRIMIKAHGNYTNQGIPKTREAYLYTLSDGTLTPMGFDIYDADATLIP